MDSVGLISTNFSSLKKKKLSRTLRLVCMSSDFVLLTIRIQNAGGFMPINLLVTTAAVKYALR